jgi:hypothetical protein
MQGEIEPLREGMVDASHLISNEPATSAPICTLQVKPRDQTRCTLGFYKPGARLRGFSVELDREADDTVATVITNIRVGSKLRLDLHVSNFGDKPLKATAREL